MSSRQVHVVAFGYREDPGVHFEDLVEEFAICLRQEGMNRRTISYDNDDMALLTSDSTTIGLAWVARDRPDRPDFLLVLFGEMGDPAALPEGLHRRLYARALKSLSEHLPYDSVFRASFDDLEIDSRLIDRFSDELRFLHVDMTPKPAETEVSTEDLAARRASVESDLSDLKELYDQEERHVRRMFAHTSMQGNFAYLYRSVVDGASGHFREQAATFRKVMFERNYPFEHMGGDAGLDGSGPRRSLIFGDRLIRKKQG